jgi:hypothetical protein
VKAPGIDRVGPQKGKPFLVFTCVYIGKIFLRTNELNRTVQIHKEASGHSAELGLLKS